MLTLLGLKQNLLLFIYKPVMRQLKKDSANLKLLIKWTL